jgi:hypothetical protein
MLKPAIRDGDHFGHPDLPGWTALLARCDEADVDATIEALKPILSITTEVGMSWKDRRRSPLAVNVNELVRGV